MQKAHQALRALAVKSVSSAHEDHGYLRVAYASVAKRDMYIQSLLRLRAPSSASRSLIPMALAADHHHVEDRNNPPP
jgi:hypothetical protein